MDAIDRASDAVEREALASFFTCCPERTKKALGYFCDEIDGALLLGASEDSSILLNRCVGIGSEGPVNAARVKKVEAHYAAKGIQRYFLHIYADEMDPDERIFDGTRLEKARSWMTFARGTDSATARANDFEIRAVSTESEALDAGRIAAPAFDMSDAAAAIFVGLMDDPRWTTFVAYKDGVAAGTGSLFIDGELAWLDWGATSPAFRGQGCQGAVLAARINKAIRCACQRMFTETGEATEGDPQYAYSNIVRFGFEERRVRQNWAPPQP